MYLFPGPLPFTGPLLRGSNTCKINNCVYFGFYSCTEATPTMPELLNFKVGYRNINIPREIGSRYQNFGVQLLLEHTSAHILDLEHQYQRNGEEINCHILQEWLKGRGRKPITWATLAMVLHNIEKGELAAKLEAFSSVQS